MISRGWIFPDGTEYELTKANTHVSIIRSFFEWLDEEDNDALRIKILDELDKYYCTFDLERYVIIRLGWILVGYANLMLVKYAGFSFQEEYILPYEENNWNIYNEYMSEEQFLKIEWKPQ